MAWKPEYAAARRAKYQSDPTERERRKAQGRTPDENREYMRAYYGANKDKWEPTPERLERKNSSRRNRYAEDPEWREKHLAAVKEWQRANPDKRHAQRLRKYGLTRARYYEMLAEQGGVCAICGTDNPGDRRTTLFFVDHCHATGRVRGLLCSPCNLGIGKFGDEPERLERAAVYVRAHQWGQAPDQ